MEFFITQGDSFVKKNSPFPYYEGYKDKYLVGYVYDTSDIVSGKMGYVGPIEILVEIDLEGKIKNLKIIKQNETPEYASGITKKKFLGRFRGKDSSAGFIIGKDVDAITQATVSSKSVADILSESLKKVSSALGLDIKAVESQARDKKTVTIFQNMKKAGLEPKEASYYKKLK